MLPMADASDIKNGEAKVMLGFIVRRCATDIGHVPTPDEFARWANGQHFGGKRYCLFGKEISSTAAKVMFSQPGRLVTVSPQGLARIWKVSRH
jgi:hypothetical protein